MNNSVASQILIVPVVLAIGRPMARTMGTIKICDTTELFNLFLEPNKHQNLARLSHLVTNKHHKHQNLARLGHAVLSTNEKFRETQRKADEATLLITRPLGGPITLRSIILCFTISLIQASWLSDECKNTRGCCISNYCHSRRSSATLICMCACTAWLMGPRDVSIPMTF